MASTDMRHKALAGGLLGAACAVLLVAYWPFSSTGDARTPAVHGVQEIPAPSNSVQDAAVTRTSVALAPSEAAARTSLYVVNGGGQPMGGVGVWREESDIEWYSSDQSCFLGHTDASGHMTLPDTADKYAIHVGSPGYVTVRLLPAPREETLVTLSYGGQVVCHCRDMEDVPLQGCVVALASSSSTRFGRLLASRRTPPLPAADCVPSGSGDVVFVGQAGVDGVVTITGLPPGGLAYHAWGSWDLALAIGPGLLPPDNSTIDIGGVYTLRFVRLYIASCLVQGDEIVSSEGVPTRRSLKERYSLSRSGMAAGALTAKLREKHPEPVFMSVLPMGESIDLKLVLKRSGVRRVQLPYVTLEEFEAKGPVSLEATKLAKTGESVRTLTLRMFNDDGTELTGLRCRLMPNPFPGHLTWTEIHTGKASLVPCGHYRLGMFDTEVQLGLGGLDDAETMVIVDPGKEESVVEKTVTLRHKFVPIKLVGDSRTAVRYAKVSGSGVKKPVSLDLSGRATLYLTVGRYVFEDLSGATLGTFDVGAVQTDPPVEVQLRRQ